MEYTPVGTPNSGVFGWSKTEIMGELTVHFSKFTEGGRKAGTVAMLNVWDLAEALMMRLREETDERVRESLRRWDETGSLG